MQPSPELRAFVEQVFRNLTAQTVDAELASYSAEPGSIFIGTDPKEWCEGLAAWEPIVRAVAQNYSGNLPADLQIEAMQEGTVGWVAARWTRQLPDGRSLHFRDTGVCHQVNGAWKAVQWHASVAVPDELAPTVAH